MIPREIIDEVRARVDISEVVAQAVTLQRKGASLMGLCPFHQEKSPSFSVVPSKGIYHCFGCGEGGDVFKFLQKTRGLSFVEAVKELADGCGVVVPERELSQDERKRMAVRASLYDVCDMAAGWFHSVLRTRSEGRRALRYLHDRGVSDETIDRYRLGFAPDTWSGLLDHLHRQGIRPEQALQAGLARSREGIGGAYDLFRGRVMVPIQDLRGRVVAFGGRVLLPPDATDRQKEAPKYVNSPETPVYKKSGVLYGLYQARAEVQKKDRLIVVEGYFDVLALHQAGFREAVATCGTSLTPGHLETIARLTQDVVAQFDSDEAGMRAASKVLEDFYAHGLEPRRLDLSPSKDPDEFIQSHGPDGFEARLASARSLFELVLDRHIQRFGRTPVGTEKVVREVASVLRHLPAGGARRLALVDFLGRKLGVDERIVREHVGRMMGGGRPQGAGPTTGRWRGNAELNHLLWLLLHHPQEVAAVVAAADPELVTERESVRAAMGMLLAGTPLAEVLEALQDDDLAMVLRAAAARDGLYTPTQAAPAAQQILRKLELRRVLAEMATVDRALADAVASGDVSRNLALLKRRQTLQNRRRSLSQGENRA